MKFAKRIAAAVTALALTATIAACHKADEVAATYQDIKISSGLYLAMLIEADGSARSKVNEQISSSNTSSSATSSEVNYGKQTVSTDDGDVKYYDYVRDQAKKLVRQYIATEVLAKQNKVTLSDEDNTYVNAYVNYYWDNYGYKVIYEKNGVNKDSFTKYYSNAGYLRSNLFKYLYGAEGPNAIAAADISKYMNENYCIADIIEAKLTNTDSEGNSKALTDDEKADLLKKMKGYAERIEKGESFETINNEYNGKSDSTDGTSSDTSSNTSSDTSSTASSNVSSADSSNTSSNTASGTSSGADEKEELKPLDSNAQVLSSEKTGSESENFDKIYAMKTGEVQVIESDDCYMLAVKGDISADPYYIDYLDENIRSLLKGDEFNDMLDKKGNELDITFNDSEIRYLSPKKIDYSNED